MIDSTTDLRAAQSALDSEMAALRLRQSEIAAEARRRLEAEHVALVADCRAAKARATALREEVEGAKLDFMRAQGALQNARNLYAQHRESRPDFSDYPSVTEMELWRSREEQKRTEMGDAELRYASASETYQALRTKWMNANEAFQKLADQERELRAQLNPTGRSGITFEVLDGIDPVMITRG